MTLRPEYSLGHSPYNDFLFAAVGVERSGADATGDDLTVLSALTRLQLDPWREAARLAGLPPDVASHALAVILGRLSEVNWATVDAATTAQRLVALLPSSSFPAVPAMPEASASDGKAAAGSTAYAAFAVRKPKWSLWLGWAVLFVLALTIVMYLKPSNNLEPVVPRTNTTQQ